MSKINLNEAEAKSLKNFHQYCKVKLDRTRLGRNGGLIPITGTYAIKSFVISYFAERGINAKVEDADIQGFRSVGMHTDNIYDDGIETLIIPLKGEGELCHFRDKKIKESQFICGRKSYDKIVRPLRLDQTKPHSFIAETDCYAILAGVDKESLEKLFDLS